MQPVFKAWDELTNRWMMINDSVRTRVKARSLELRIVQVASLAFMTIAAAFAISLALNGSIALLTGGGVIGSFVKLTAAGILGIAAYDLMRFQQILSCCRTAFTEIVSPQPSESKAALQAMMKEARAAYDRLLFIDTVCDSLRASLSLLLIFLLPFCLFGKSYTLEEKVGQHLMVHFRGEVANGDAKRLIDEAHVGGFVYFNWANGLTGRHLVRELSRSLQQASPIPLLLAVDQEGGRVLRLTNEFSKPPSNGVIGKCGAPARAATWAKTVGAELASVGINMNLAPCADVNSNPANPVIGDRSYSSDPWTVARFARAALSGYAASGVIAVLKHFPGHGDTNVDSHIALPVVAKGLRELEAVELVPFRALVGEAQVVMTAHLMVPFLDEQNPVTLSRAIVTNLLRDTLGFDGVVMTDSLVMQGLLDHCPDLSLAAVRALEAGHDILLLGGQQKDGTEITVEQVIAIHRTIVDAIRSGRLSESELDRSFSRIMRLKKANLSL